LGIVQRKKVSQKQLSSIFWFNTITSYSSAGLLAIIAPFAASFYNQPELRNLVYITVIPLLISPIFQVHRRLQEKELLFKNIAIIEMITSLGSGITGIVLAYLGFGVYSIVIQSASMAVFYLFSTLFFYKWRPSLYFSFQEVKSILWFSLKLKIARLVNYLQRNIDFIILSKLLMPSVYGLYTLAYRVMYFPIRRIAYSFGEILFPALSSIQDDEGKLKRAYHHSIKLISFAILPITAVLLVHPETIIQVFLGEKWIELTNILFILSFAGYFQSVESLGDNILAAIDKAEIIIFLEAVRTIITGIAVVIGSFFDLRIICISILISRFVLLLFSLTTLNKYTKFNTFEIVSSLKIPFIFSGMLILVFLLEKEIFNINNNYLQLGIIIAIVGIYFVAAAFQVPDVVRVIFRRGSNNE
jgi:O-antigen/teichoic acid export membrane protein